MELVSTSANDGNFEQALSHLFLVINLNVISIRRGVIVLVSLLAVATVLTWQERRFRQGQAALSIIPPAPNTLPAQVDQTPAALAALFGLMPVAGNVPSHEALELRAVFFASAGRSRVLLGDAKRQSMHRVGDRLPGASVIRRIERDAVVLWREGREERLQLVQAAPVFALAGSAPGARPLPPELLVPAQTTP